MIVAKFVKAIRVRRDYEIDIEFNVSFEEFQALYLEGEPEEAKRPEQIQFWRWKQKSKASMTLALLLVNSEGVEPSTPRMEPYAPPRPS